MDIGLVPKIFRENATNSQDIPRFCESYLCLSETSMFVLIGRPLIGKHLFLISSSNSFIFPWIFGITENSLARDDRNELNFLMMLFFFCILLDLARFFSLCYYSTMQNIHKTIIKENFLSHLINNKNYLQKRKTVSISSIILICASKDH